MNSALASYLPGLHSCIMTTNGHYALKHYKALKILSLDNSDHAFHTHFDNTFIYDTLMTPLLPSAGCEDVFVENLSLENLVPVLTWSNQPHESQWVHRQALHFLTEEFLQVGQ